MRIIIALLFLCTASVYSQIPDWVEEEMQRMVGTWVADNSAYLSEQETDDAYAITWTWGEGNKNIEGELYGMNKGKKTTAYWLFFQYWDPVEEQLRLVQVSPERVIGKGFIERIDATHTKLQQTFTMPDGQSYQTGHTTQITGNSEITVSYTIKEGEWIPDRRYTWNKQ